MEEERFEINGIPALLLGRPADALWLFIHGKQGCKEEARDFAPFVLPMGAQVLSVDLPGHGERTAEADSFVPWRAVPELSAVMDYARSRWGSVSLRANSIGAWFSMLAFADKMPEKSLFVSPLLDMSGLIANMMVWSGVTEAELERRGRIETNFGETLDIEYLRYARDNPIVRWTSETDILYAGHDQLTSRAAVDAFAARFGCTLTVMEDGEHWFHTPEQLRVLGEWTARCL